MAKKNVSSGSVRYHKLKQADDGFIDLQLSENSENIVSDCKVENGSDISDVSLCPISFFLPFPTVPKQFQKPEAKIPWKAIMLAIFLFVIGTTMLIFASLMFSGYMEHTDGNWALLILGLVMFIPGFYHVRIAYYAYCRYPGYSFDDIPDFD